MDSKTMKETVPLYNSRLAKIYIDYLHKYYPEIDVDLMLEEAGINDWELEDPSHWFTQEQQDRLHDTLVSHTDNENIARDAGRYAHSSEGLGAIRQYIIGLMNPTAIFMLIGKIYPLLSRAAVVRSFTSPASNCSTIPSSARICPPEDRFRN